MTVLVIFLQNNLVTIACLFFLMVAFLLLFYFQKKSYQKTEIEQIQYVNHQAEDSLSSLLEQMPVGVVKLNMESSEIEWFNPYAELMLTTEDGEIDLPQSSRNYKNIHIFSWNLCKCGGKTLCGASR